MQHPFIVQAERGSGRLHGLPKVAGSCFRASSAHSPLAIVELRSG